MNEVQLAAERWRQATLELVAAALENAVRDAAGALRGGPPAPPPPPGAGFRHYADSAHLPQPEEGDELSGLAREAAIRGGAIPPADGITEQDGMTEEEYEEGRR